VEDPKKKKKKKRSTATEEGTAGGVRVNDVKDRAEDQIAGKWSRKKRLRVCLP